jgi:hypothetical protein
VTEATTAIEATAGHGAFRASLSRYGIFLLLPALLLLGGAL